MVHRERGAVRPVGALHPAVRRMIEADAEVATAFDVLIGRLSGSDLTSLLLEVMRRRAGTRSAAAVLRHYESDRFVQPSTADAVALARLSADVLEAVSSRFDPVELAPLAPLGVHTATADVDQNRVITTTRQTEVQADPTNALALEAAVRRRALLRNEPRSTAPVRLSTVQRVVRAQRFDGPLSFAHFSLLALVVAGRDTGSGRFETDAIVDVISTLADLVARTSGRAVHVELTDFDGGFSAHLDEIADRVPQAVLIDPDRDGGQNYYANLCFKIWLDDDGQRLELGDGGVVNWTSGLLQNHKERLAIGALSLERLLAVGDRA